MRRNQFVNSRGEIVDTDDGVCPDGCGVRTSVMLLDGLQREVAQHYGRRPLVVDALGRVAGNRPGFLLMDTQSAELREKRALADAAYRELEKRDAAAWRTNVAVAQTNSDSGSSFEVAKLTPADARDAAFAELEKREAEAWRGGQ